MVIWWFWLPNRKMPLVIGDSQVSKRATPSLTGFNDRERLLGDVALAQIRSNAKNTCRNFKHLLGRKSLTWINEQVFVRCSNAYLGLSENSVSLHPMVLLIIIPTKWLFHWGYTPFSDIPKWVWCGSFWLFQKLGHSWRHKFRELRLESPDLQNERLGLAPFRPCRGKMGVASLRRPAEDTLC